jgi:hypothetical protein
VRMVENMATLTADKGQNVSPCASPPTPPLLKNSWNRVLLAAFDVTLLTSDRPLDMPLRFSSKDAYIALLIGSRMLFAAAHDNDWADRLAAENATKVVESVNQAVVHHARKFVWGTNDSHSRFVQNRMSKAPDRPMITEKQKQAAATLDSLFDMGYHTKHVDTIFKRVFGA